MTDSRDIFCPAGTADPTPGMIYAHTEYAPRAIKQPKAGEIWTNKKGDERLVMRVFDRHCIGLLLQTKSRFGADLAVTTVSGIRYENPTMPAVMLRKDYGEFINACAEDEYAEITQAYQETFGGVIDSETLELLRNEVGELSSELRTQKALNTDMMKMNNELEQRLKEARTTGPDGIYKTLYESLLDRVLKERGL